MNSLRFFSHFCVSTNCYKLSEDSMPNRNQGTFLPSACGNTLVLCGQVRVLRFRSDMSNFDQHLA